jgi:hypothetical protein
MKEKVKENEFFAEKEIKSADAWQTGQNLRKGTVMKMGDKAIVE